MKSFGSNNSEKEHIREIIEKGGSGDNGGLLRDILFAIKELNLKREKDNKSLIIGNEKDKHPDYLEIKMELKEMQNRNKDLKEDLDNYKNKYQDLKK